ncbi:MAG: TolC family protein [Gemmataceae bacterium]
MIRSTLPASVFCLMLLLVGITRSQDIPRPDLLPDPKPALPGEGSADDLLPLPRSLLGKGLGKPPVLGGPLIAGSPVGQPTSVRPLELQQVLDSVAKHYPLIFAAEQERQVVAGNQLAAQGAFDRKLKSDIYENGGTYAHLNSGVGIEQLTPYQGFSYTMGYRLGVGNYPIYWFDRKTGDAGEFRAGVTMPLLRDRDIDSARATLAKTSIDQQMAEPVIRLQRIDIARAATLSYWSWVATGQRYLITRDILRLATQRDDQLRKRVAAGNLAQIEREDNKRIIIDREARLVASQRGFQLASLNLSLYLRDEHGNPSIPRLEDLPAFLEPPHPPLLDQRLKDLELAILKRPEIQRLALQRQKIQVDIDLAENQMLPGLNMGFYGARDLGYIVKGVNRDLATASMVLDVPLERRQARGRILAARAELARVLAQERMARDRVQVDLQSSLNGIDRAYDLLQRGRDNKKQNQYLAEAEQRQFDVGKSDLFRVNIRELQAAEARMLEVDAAAEFYRSLADYHASIGMDTTAPPADVPVGGTSPTEKKEPDLPSPNPVDRPKKP